MTLKNDELDLIRMIYKHLKAEGIRLDLASSLEKTIVRLEDEKERQKLGNRERARRNRENGYLWASSHNPRKSKYLDKKGE